MKPSILVVEDDPAFLALLTTVLEMQGYAVTCADSTLGTLEQARRVRPCAIVLDLGLPYRLGTALLSELRAHPETADMPVIIVSALPEALTPERRALADAVLAKPIDPPVLFGHAPVGSRPPGSACIPPTSVTGPFAARRRSRALPVSDDPYRIVTDVSAIVYRGLGYRVRGSADSEAH